MKIEVLHTRWTCDHGAFEGGVHEIAKPKAGLVEQIGAAADLSDPPLRVLSATKEERARMAGAVQSQAEGEKLYDAAQRHGKWQLGNVRSQAERYRATLKAHEDPSDDFALDERQLALLQRVLPQTERILRHMEKGKLPYERAVERALAEEASA